MKPVIKPGAEKYRRSRAERGAVLVEFALVAPLLLLLLVGIANLGLIIHEHQVVQNAAREGARFSALPLSSPLATGGSTAAIKQRVVNYCQKENIVITTANVTVNQAYPIAVGGMTALGSQVSVSYTRSTLFPGLPMASVALTGMSVFRNLY